MNRILHLGARLLVFVSLMLGLVGTTKLAAQDAETTSAYTISIADRLRISVYQEDDLSDIVRVNSKGAVNLKLAGEVFVGGLTIREAQSVIEGAYREGRYLRNPQVTINVEDYAGREVTINGEVRAPGRYPLPIESTMTVLELVTKAQGFTDTAKGTAVSVTRVKKDGTKEVRVIDVDSLIKGKDRANTKDPNLILKPGDIVYVPQRLI